MSPKDPASAEAVSPEYPDVFQYTDLPTYLGAWWTYQTLVEGWTLQQLAEEIGSPSSKGALSRLFAGKDRLSERRLEQLRPHLELGRLEERWLDLLFELQEAVSEHRRQRIRDLMAELRVMAEARRSQPGFARDWLAPAVRELAQCEDFVLDPAWIASRLRFPVTEERIRQAIEVLFEAEVLHRKENGELVVDTDKALVVLPTPRNARQVEALYRSIFGLALESFDDIYDPEHPGFHARCRLGMATLPIAESALPALFALVDELPQRAVALSEERPANHVYQLVVQAFPLTRTPFEGEAAPAQPAPTRGSERPSRER